MAAIRQPTYPAALNMAKLIYTLATQGRSLTLADIQRLLSISARTARRYRRAINDFLTNRQGEPLIAVTRVGGVERWRLNETTPLEGTPYQLISLYVGAILMASLDQTVVRDGLLDIFAALEEAIPLAQRSLLKHYEKKFYATGFGRRHYALADEHIDVILRGLLNQYKLSLQYRSQTGERHYLVRPYTLVLHREALYLNALVEDYQEIRTFRVENILAVKLTKEGFEFPLDYTPEAFYDKSFGVFRADGEEITVVIEFPEYLYDYVAKRTWMSRQEISGLQDGKFQMRVVVSNLFEIFHWVMGIGSDARVLAPEELKNMVRLEAEKILAHMAAEKAEGSS
ncbi:MAG: helix-turn-helix transcriptional regulator [Desulfobacca sp.]|uniref:helix-turn-helix transcriptional regulator n=1 Tax=Desulfobacca sp. TaxID=2067990 RepID=UPI0040499592